MGKINLGRLQTLRAMSSRVVLVDGMEVALFKLADGEVRAVKNSCPHKGGKLSEGIVCGHHVYCPLHDWKIDLRTGRAEPPDEGGTAVFPTESAASGEPAWILHAPDRSGETE